MKKKILIVIIVLICILVLIGLITGYKDSKRVSQGIEPKYTIKIVTNYGDKVTYWGLGYKVINYPYASIKDSVENNKNIKFGSWFMKYELESDNSLGLITNDITTIEPVIGYELSFYSKENSDIEEILKLDDYSIKTLGGEVNVTIENGSVFSFRDALFKEMVTPEQILENAKKDVEDGKIKSEIFDDGGSVEYYYDDYTILKLNTLKGDKDMVIGKKGTILNDYNVYKSKQEEKSFKAKVLKNEGNHTLTVEVTENSEFFQKGENVEVKVKNNEYLDVQYSEDMILEIKYDGIATRSIPPQINSLSISVLMDKN